MWGPGASAFVCRCNLRCVHVAECHHVCVSEGKGVLLARQHCACRRASRCVWQGLCADVTSACAFDWVCNHWCTSKGRSVLRVDTTWVCR